MEDRVIYIRGDIYWALLLVLRSKGTCQLIKLRELG